MFDHQSPLLLVNLEFVKSRWQFWRSICAFEAHFLVCFVSASLNSPIWIVSFVTHQKHRLNFLSNIMFLAVKMTKIKPRKRRLCWFSATRSGLEHPACTSREESTPGFFLQKLHEITTQNVFCPAVILRGVRSVSVTRWPPAVLGSQKGIIMQLNDNNRALLLGNRKLPTTQRGQRGELGLHRRHLKRCWGFMLSGEEWREQTKQHDVVIKWILYF